MLIIKLITKIVYIKFNFIKLELKIIIDFYIHFFDLKNLLIFNIYNNIKFINLIFKMIIIKVYFN